MSQLDHRGVKMPLRTQLSHYRVGSTRCSHPKYCGMRSTLLFEPRVDLDIRFERGRTLETKAMRNHRYALRIAQWSRRSKGRILNIRVSSSLDPSQELCPLEQIS